MVSTFTSHYCHLSGFSNKHQPTDCGASHTLDGKVTGSCLKRLPATFLPSFGGTLSHLPGICRSLCACSLGAWWLNRSGGLRWKSRKAITCSSRILCGAAIAPQAAQTKEKATTPLIRPTERCPEQALLSVGAGQIRGFGFIVELPGLLSRTEAMVGCLMTTSLLLSTSPQQKLKA